MSVICIDSQERFEKLALGQKPLVIEFLATWCKPCEYIAPSFEGLAKEFQQLQFGYIDVDNTAFGFEFSQRLGIRATPTFQIIEKGVKVEERVGADKDKLRAMVTDYLGLTI
ncbi:hypothetical protein O181_078258 [Austropuccinia psidii MF-1]|uniref:Thioredoxin n=1 Tax=Austropuccinia psidii MF-1 TaxID=1389203 RepID=A0A9Q3FIM2_9BASI|nr:hypothetical protein [Austropuccinia psidii MF-1]